jgi:hypothetical protein
VTLRPCFGLCSPATSGPPFILLIDSRLTFYPAERGGGGEGQSCKHVSSALLARPPPSCWPTRQRADACIQRRLALIVRGEGEDARKTGPLEIL